jgi:hypothetical protein
MVISEPFTEGGKGRSEDWISDRIVERGDELELTLIVLNIS